MHFDFEAKFGALFEVHFIHTIYLLEAWEVKSLTL